MPSKRLFWLSLSLITALVFALTALHYQYETAYTVNDDTRVHLFWMMRFLDSELFPGDLIADYFQSVAPLGFTFLYKIFALLNISPFIVGKFLPIVLIIITTFYCFEVGQKIFPVPLAGFISTLLLNQNLFLRDDIYSSTPRAFIYPLFLAFLYYLLKGSIFGLLITITLQGLFYPHTLLISFIILLIRFFSKKNDSINFKTKDYKYYYICILLPILIIFIYSIKIPSFGSVITEKQAIKMPEFLLKGRSYFFASNPLEFWLYGERSGIFPQEWPYTLAFSFGCFIPILKKYAYRFPLATKINSSVWVFLQILLASILMFALAHLLLFKLHLPSRYTQHTIRITLALADGIVITVLLDCFRRLLKIKGFNQPILKLLGISALICLLIFPSYAASKYPERLSYVTGKSPAIYQYLKEQPKNSVIASLTSEADFIPTFAQRSVLTGEEYAIPYHTGYYSQIRQRTKDLIRSQYSTKLEDVKNIIKQYKIDFWLLDKQSFTPEYIANNSWLMQFQPEASQAIEIITQGQMPALETIAKGCAILAEKDLFLVSSDCLVKYDN